MKTKFGILLIKRSFFVDIFGRDESLNNYIYILIVVLLDDYVTKKIGAKIEATVTILF